MSDYEDLIARLRDLDAQSETWTINDEAAEAITTLQAELAAARAESEENFVMRRQTFENALMWQRRAEAAETALAAAREEVAKWLAFARDLPDGELDWKTRAETAEASLEEVRDEIARLNKELDDCFVKRDAAEAELATVASFVNPMWQAKHASISADWIIEQLILNEAEHVKEHASAEALVKELEKERDEARRVNQTYAKRLCAQNDRLKGVPALQERAERLRLAAEKAVEAIEPLRTDWDFADGYIPADLTLADIERLCAARAGLMEALNSPS